MILANGFPYVLGAYQTIFRTPGTVKNTGRSDGPAAAKQSSSNQAAHLEAKNKAKLRIGKPEPPRAVVNANIRELWTLRWFFEHDPSRKFFQRLKPLASEIRQLDLITLVRHSVAVESTDAQAEIYSDASAGPILPNCTNCTSTLFTAGGA